MSINKYEYKVQETSTSTGASGLTLAGATTSYQSFLDTVGDDTYFSYHIVNDDNTLEWEYGVGYVDDDSVAEGILIRSQVLSSSNSGSSVVFSAGTKTVTLIETQKDITSFKHVSSDETIGYFSATYVVDASAANVTLTLPSIDTGFDTTGNEQAVTISVVLNSTTGSQTEQADAITITPDGSDTVGGSASYVLSILNDFVQIVADTTNDNWVVLDPIQDSVYPSGGDGAIQFAEDQGFSYSSGLYWNLADESLNIGASGTADANILLPASGNVVVNNQNYNIDVQIKTENEDNTFYVDGSTDRLGVGTSSPEARVDVVVSGTDGVNVRTDASGSIPRLMLENSYTGISAGDDIGSIVFRSLDSADNDTDYAKILVEFISDIDGSEEGLMKLQINKDGALQTVAEFAYSGVVIGADNTNINGIVLGEQHTNNGDNILLGYSHSVSGTNVIAIGQNNSIPDGTVGCAFGVDHTVSGSNIWVIGGSGLVANTDNTVNVCYDPSNYLEMAESGHISYYGMNSTDGLRADFVNTNVLSSASSDNLSLVFYNSVGSAVTGLAITSNITSPTDGAETTSLTIDGVDSGTRKALTEISSSGIVVGYNDVSSDNIFVGVSNTGDGSNNIVLGQDVVVSGNDNVVVGDTNIVVSGTGNVSVLGSNNTVDSSGNHNILVAGIGNTADEDYSITLGINNSNSGLYGTLVGFDNGADGSYISILGENNLVTNDSSIAVGNNNNLNSSDINAQGFAFGAGNTMDQSATGLAVGFDNTAIGVGATIVGIDNYSSGNNIVLGNDLTVSGDNNIVIGSGITLTDDNVISIANTGASVTLDGSTFSVLGEFEVNGSGIEDMVNDTINSALTGAGSVDITVVGDDIIVSGTDVYDPEIIVTGTGILTGGGSFTLNQTGTETINITLDTSSDLDMGTSKILYSNVYATTGDLPTPSYHGMFAHVHAEAAAYYGHGGNWIKLANDSDLGQTQSSITDGTGTLDFDVSTNTLRLDTHFIPSGDASYDLGSSSKKWRDLYLDGSSLHLGARTIAITGSSVGIDGGIEVENVYTSGLNSSNADDNIIVSGHIIPVTNSDFDIGSAEKKVRHLFLSDNSLYFGENEIAVSVSGTDLMVNGATSSQQNNVLANGSNDTWGGSEITVVMDPSVKLQGTRTGIPRELTLVLTSGIVDCVITSAALGLSSYALSDTSTITTDAFYNIPLSEGAILSAVSATVNVEISYTGVGSVPSGVDAIALIQGVIL